MKIVVLFLLIGVTQTFALDSYAQTKRISLNLKNATINRILDEIEDQSEFYFMFDGTIIDVYQRKSINCENQSITTILDQLLKDTHIIYEISDRQIVLFREQDSEVGQQKTISGKVTDSGGSPLPGVTVTVKGTTQGTITDADGNYSLSNVPDNATLVFSFVGMRSQEVVAGNKTNIDLVMEEDLIGIEEVVAIGYGVQKKVNLTGSVSSVSSNVLLERATTNATNLLQGRVTGLNVTQPSGQPGKDDAIFQIRGLGSFGASSSPLVLIDGVSGSLSNLAPNDIENITVLKDAASASIYGSRAANGVILVTTKKAVGASVEYQLDIGVHNATRMPELITNSAEYMEMYNSAAQR
ncbi:SusC/RagA family TonB-linked outer membrane protein, partial [Mariniphaga sediminis]|uniref:SusC/RagA family TonB-linked outer membrane protein n=1 Tax=Mariniphaga sediminis TaxID=1628158 RepID=UPI0035649646